ASGAVDYLSKPMDVEEIRATVRKALGRSAEAQAALPVAGEELGGVVGRSPAMVEVYKTIARVAPGRSTVLILGESGTGKELIARAIHQNSPRRKRPFVAIDCGGLTETLLESELFGHVRGAFTGAIGDAPGLFAEADGGTIFLDEIGDVSPALQAKLLRVLQEHQIRPVGGSVWRAVDVRVIAATKRELAHALERGVALAQQEVLTAEDLPDELRRPGPAPARATPEDRPTLAELKRRYVHRVFEESGGNVSRAAQVLGVDRRSLYRMLQRYGVTPRGGAQE